MIRRPEPRAVLDTNVVICAFHFPASAPRGALDFALDHGKLLISLTALTFLRRGGPCLQAWG
jgi:hypothetical protein